MWNCAGQSQNFVLRHLVLTEADAKKRGADQRRLENPRQGALKNSDPAPQPGRGTSRCFFSSRAMRLKLAVFSKAVLDARASFKLSSWPVYGPLVVPRSVLRLLEFGLVRFPASSQSSDSIVEGQEGCNPPHSESAAGFTGRAGGIAFRQKPRAPRSVALPSPVFSNVAQ
jgi:hypothetical protein